MPQARSLWMQSWHPAFKVSRSPFRMCEVFQWPTQLGKEVSYVDSFKLQNCASQTTSGTFMNRDHGERLSLTTQEYTTGVKAKRHKQPTHHRDHNQHICTTGQRFRQHQPAPCLSLARDVSINAMEKNAMSGKVPKERGAASSTGFSGFQ